MLLLGTVLDVVSTWYGLTKLEHTSEMNVAVAWFMQKFGVLFGLIIFKSIVVLVACTVDSFCSSRSFILTCSLITWIAVFSNFYHYVRW